MDCGWRPGQIARALGVARETVWVWRKGKAPGEAMAVLLDLLIELHDAWVQRGWCEKEFKKTATREGVIGLTREML